MELLEAQTLRQVVGAGLVPVQGHPQGEPLQIGELLDLAIQIADRLGAAHVRGHYPVAGRAGKLSLGTFELTLFQMSPGREELWSPR
jgi:hypothetical protein